MSDTLFGINDADASELATILDGCWCGITACGKKTKRGIDDVVVLLLVVTGLDVAANWPADAELEPNIFFLLLFVLCNKTEQSHFGNRKH